RQPRSPAGVFIVCQGRSRRSARWALSSLDFCVHLVEPESDHPPAGVLTARCGHLLATVVHQHDQPPPSRSARRSSGRSTTSGPW
ncbi:MAG: hypothetical protein ACRDS0_41355, partial [Pseudonocardiaceae bacterium]